MVRLILFLVVVAAAATGLAWLADRPGNLVINWEGYEIETSVFRAVVLLSALIGAALFIWSIMRQIWSSPAAVGQFMSKRRQQRGLEALSSGMIAIGAGDRNSATRYAIQARKSLPNEPLTHLLRAQAAQLSGDGATSRRIFEAMLASPDTEQLGLRGLFLEAHRENETEAARQFAERAIALNPKLGWAVDSLFALQCKEKDWPGALETVAVARKHGHIERVSADRRRAVLLTAQAIEKEDSDPERSLNLAIEAHGLAPDLVPAASLAGRMLASRGNTPRATKIIQKAWSKSPHPDLATAYAYARLGDSPRDRFDRVRQLAALNPMSVESAIAAASAGVEAKAFDEARSALEPYLEGRLTQRICLLMARIEGEQHGNKGRVREWLARAVNAPRDPAWTADGIVADQWQPVSPVSGALDAFQWRVPLENADKADSEILQKKLEELVPLGATTEPALTAKPIDASMAGDNDAETVPSQPYKPAMSAERQRAAMDAHRPAPVVRSAQHRTSEPQPVQRSAEVADADVIEPPGAPAIMPRPSETERRAPQPLARPAESAQPTRTAPQASSPPIAAVTPAAALPAAKTTPSIIAQTSPPATTEAPAPAPAARKDAPAPAPTIKEANAKASAAYARLSEKTRPAAAAPVEAKDQRASATPEKIAPAASRPAPVGPTSGGRPGSRDNRAAESKVFVPPRAPDDPGPDTGDAEELQPPTRGYRVSN